jgi:hypothetical protein
MSTQYRLVQSGKTASGGCSAGPRFVRAVAPRIIIIIIITLLICLVETIQVGLLGVHSGVVCFSRSFYDCSLIIYLVYCNILADIRNVRRTLDAEKLKSNSDGDDSGSKKYIGGYGGACGGVLHNLYLDGV